MISDVSLPSVFSDVTRHGVVEVCSNCGRLRKLVGERTTYDGSEKIGGYFVLSPRLTNNCSSHVWRKQCSK